jgi:uncharacterized membrane protein
MTQATKHPRPTRGEIVARVSAVVPTDIETVFDYLSDLENNPEWNWAVVSTTSMSKGSGVGSRYLQRKAWPRKGKTVLEVTAHSRPTLLEVEGRLEDGPVTYRYDLEPSGEGSTLVEVTVSYEANGQVARPEIYGARLEDAIAGNLHTLKGVLTP